MACSVHSTMDSIVRADYELKETCSCCGKAEGSVESTSGSCNCHVTFSRVSKKNSNKRELTWLADNPLLGAK